MARAKVKEREKKEVVPYRAAGMPSVFDEMDRLFADFFGRRFGPVLRPRMFWPEEFDSSFPSVDVFEDRRNVFVKAEVPGVSKDDIDVNITEDTVTIRGEKRREEKVEEKDYYRLERTYGSFQRTLPLPSGVQSAKASARFKDGVLEIKIPKAPSARKREVKVKIE